MVNGYSMTNAISHQENVQKNIFTIFLTQYMIQIAGVMPYDEPALWRGGVIIALVVLVILLALILLLALCWYRKSRRRKEEEMGRKEFMRASVRLSKLEKEHRNSGLWNKTTVCSKNVFYLVTALQRSTIKIRSYKASLLCPGF